MRVFWMACLSVLLPVSAMAERVEMSHVSEQLQKQVALSVHLPASYAMDADKTYPVLYVLDGQEHGKHSFVNAQFLASTDVMPEIIVVAVNSTQRFTYYTPTRDNDDPRPSGKAAAFLSFLENELMPKMNQSYRTSGFDMLAGHSLGGLFTAYALQQKTQAFDAYFMFSPSMWWDQQALVAQTQASLSETAPFVYLSLANEQGMQKSAFDAYVQSLSKQGWAFEYSQFDNEDHMTIPLVSQIDALRYVFADWLLSFDDIVAQPHKFITHYEKLNARFGTNIQGQEWQIGQPVQHIVNQLKDAHKANQAADIHLQVFPESQWAYKSKADAQALQGNVREAVEYMQQAVAIAEKNQDSYLQSLQQELTALRARL